MSLLSSSEKKNNNRQAPAKSKLTCYEAIVHEPQHIKILDQQ